jgi:hypothetical protein
MTDETKHVPYGFFNRRATTEERAAHDKFQALNKFVTERHGWITSPPGAKQLRIECLPGSTLPDELAAKGYNLVLVGETERILAGSIVERFTRRADGELEPLVEGSTKPVAEVRRHAGIVRVECYDFSLP